jgi:transcriptional regulator with XRE-family HTH domain
MALVDKIQKFLFQKFSGLNLNRKDFVEQSGIPYSTVTHIMKGLILNPTINHIIKIANYFNCSIDEVIGRTEYSSLIYTKNFFHISSDEIGNNLKKYINGKVKEKNINLHNLARNIGFSNNSLSGFINSNRGQKTLNSQIVVALADYFQVSIDEMIGRIKPTTAVNSSDKNYDSNTHL